ncbi:NADH:ubiquinone oxidoreductase iron-sulfur subunit 5 [Trinorchestia longiramus]|nr:NADH:ubiquinone oxidoreductase iron-sulfur subunit 5 [Trinorchestia longiramus]
MDLGEVLIDRFKMTGLPQFHPYFRTPLTDLGSHMISHQSGGMCRDFEMRAVECVEAYGTHKAETLCRDYMDDLFECVHGDKARKRHEAMQAERKRQVAAGLRSKEDMYPVQARVEGY